ncbi:MAG: hypothetical protein LBO79_04105, partial [Zoogloeaceae bacterium]|nr:hypothetical protein [Zoogloeaceae bacterium]
NRKGKERLEKKRERTRRYPDAEKSSPLSRDNGEDFHVVRCALCVVRCALCARDRQAFSLAIARTQGRPDNRLFHFPFLSCHVPLHHAIYTQDMCQKHSNPLTP